MIAADHSLAVSIGLLIDVEVVALTSICIGEPSILKEVNRHQ